jgi:Domain of unknown function (DUF3806)
MLSFTQKIRHWLEDHNPFEAPSTRTARRRLRDANAQFGASNLKVRKELGPDGQGQNLIATRPVYPEIIEDPSREELQRIRTHADDLRYFMQAFLGQNYPTWTLNDLDLAFSAWQRSVDKGRFTPDTVVAITGAAFGEYCNEHLKTRWLMISDPAGRQLAVRSTNNRVTGWPHSTVRKRIDAGEHEFFAAVYESLRRSVEETYAD